MRDKSLTGILRALVSGEQTEPGDYERVFEALRKADQRKGAPSRTWVSKNDQKTREPEPSGK